MDPLIAYIQRFITLTDNEIDIIKGTAVLRTYRKGHHIVQQGEICRHENFILEGCTKTYFIDDAGCEHVVMLAIENWWTADLGSLISRQPADYNVQCLEKTTVLQFSYEALEKLYQEVPTLERFFRIIIQKAFVATQKRIVLNHSMPAKERYLLFRQQYPQIEQRVPQYLIASYLGISKQFLSKIRSELIFEN